MEPAGSADSWCT